jgi:hypothetical protein
MSLTLDEIVEHEKRLRREIVERECLLAAFNVLHGYAANGQNPKSMELVSLVTALSSSTARLPFEEQTASPPAPVTAALPTLAPKPRYLHPELVEIGRHSASHVQYVRWAIERMTDDYSLHDVRSLLEREGYRMKGSEISVVLTRMNRRGEIVEIKPGRGPIPAVFRKPGTATAPAAAA